MKNGWTKRILISRHSSRLIAELCCSPINLGLSSSVNHKVLDRQSTSVSAAIGKLYPRLERVDGHSGALRLLC